MKPQFLAYLLFLLIACGQAKDDLHKPIALAKRDTTIKQKPQKHINVIPPVFEKAHPNAKRFMTEKFYFNTIDESAPFGNDDGVDAYMGFKNWRPDHKNNMPGEFLSKKINEWGYPKFDLSETSFEKLKPYLLERELGSRFMSGIDAAILAIAFGQLYLEGSIDKDFKETAKASIKRQLNPELLAYWGDPDKTERETKLKKMLVTLGHIN